MTDDELIARFTRVKPSADGIRIECLSITWPQPSHPRMEWIAVKHWRPCPGDDAEASITTERRAILRQRMFFQVCARCAQRKPTGLMHDARNCQSCASAALGTLPRESDMASGEPPASGLG